MLTMTLASASLVCALSFDLGEFLATWPFCDYPERWCDGLVPMVGCVGCTDRTPEAGAHERGWRWGTFSEAGAAWLCPDCQEGPEVLW
jgi:hypothetical protein